MDINDNSLSQDVSWLTFKGADTSHSRYPHQSALPLETAETPYTRLKPWA
jgi:hypothetical protein